MKKKNFCQKVPRTVSQNLNVITIGQVLTLPNLLIQCLPNVHSCLRLVISSSSDAYEGCDTYFTDKYRAINSLSELRLMGNIMHKQSLGFSDICLRTFVVRNNFFFIIVRSRFASVKNKIAEERTNRKTSVQLRLKDVLPSVTIE